MNSTLADKKCTVGDVLSVQSVLLDNLNLALFHSFRPIVYACVCVGVCALPDYN